MALTMLEPIKRTAIFVTSVFVPTTGTRADSPLALALFRDAADGKRWTFLADGDYMRGLNDLPNVDGEPPLALHPSRLLGIPRAGWPQDWAPDAPPDLIDLADEVDRFGWQAVHARWTAGRARGSDQ
jgi:hypothetical protein